MGDGIWIARHRKLRTEYVLDFIVERKEVSDLDGSITDNRYRDQKLRLKVPSELEFSSSALTSLEPSLPSSFFLASAWIVKYSVSQIVSCDNPNWLLWQTHR